MSIRIFCLLNLEIKTIFNTYVFVFLFQVYMKLITCASQILTFIIQLNIMILKTKNLII